MLNTNCTNAARTPAASGHLTSTVASIAICATTTMYVLGTATASRTVIKTPLCMITSDGSERRRYGLEEEFHRALEQWREETGGYSLLSQKISHPAYLRIIGMGEAALPFIFAELTKQPDFWHVALSAITGHNPPPKLNGMRPVLDYWKEWAVNQGYGRRNSSSKVVA